VISAAALQELGLEYKFKTSVWIDELKNGSVGTMWIRGGGDPSFTIESAWLMARAIRSRGVKRIDKLFLDTSLFADAERRVGQRAYETGASALAFNFNSIGFEVCPTKVGSDAAITVNPWEAPVSLSGSIKTTPSKVSFAIDESPGSNYPLGAYRASGAIGAQEPCQTFFRSVKDPVAYFGITFKALLTQAGIEFRGVARPGDISKDRSAQEFYSQESKPINQIIEDLNHFSNNFIAEQLLYAIGASAGSPLTRANGLAKLTSFLKSIGVSDQISLDDASGLSHQNSISAAAINQVLLYAQKHPELQSEFETSLSFAGKTGTLKTRPLNGALVRGKTGTLDGVSSLAGYLYTPDGRKLAFAIIINGISAKSDALVIEDKIVDLLPGLEP